LAEDRPKHGLEIAYQLTATELLDAMARRFRARVALEGAVAEVHLAKQIAELHQRGVVVEYKEHDLDNYPDFTVVIGSGTAVRIEVKNIRNEPYTRGGSVIAYKVETQKTRVSQDDRTSRFYGVDQFDILAVCLGKLGRDWRQFLFIRASDLARHEQYPHKLAVMQRVPIVGEVSRSASPWHTSLDELLTNWE